MLCRSCNKRLDSTMRHAINANSCPFCGSQIFTSNELLLRKSISRVLIKNGLDNDETINKIVDDIISLNDSPTDEVRASTENSDVVVEIEDDGLTEAERRAPARSLTKAPVPTAQIVKTGGIDPIAAAMRAYEDENTDPMSRPYDTPETDDDDISGVFFMEQGGGEKANRLKTSAPRPSFSRKSN